MKPQQRQKASIATVFSHTIMHVFDSYIYPRDAITPISLRRKLGLIEIKLLVPKVTQQVH